MIKLAVLVSVCIKISTGFFEDIADYNIFPSIDNSASSGWPQQAYAYYATGEPQGLRRKPCRRMHTQASEQWVPSFTATVKKPLGNNELEPQALKNENVNNSPTEQTINPDTDEPSNFSNIPTRRSNGEDIPNNDNELVETGDYDCEIGLGTEDYYDSEYGRQHSAGDLGPATAKPTTGIEQKVIEMLKDCINKKQKYIEEKLIQPEVIPLAGSRRSMSDFDKNNDDENDDSNLHDKQATTDTNEISTIALGPGKLYNELQNPTKVTGIADFPVSRRMPADGSRICYACSTATNPSCWNPDSKTTIKYCRKDQNCVTKIIGVKNSLTILRDCAGSCDSSSVGGIEPKYKSCSVCYKDYCNSATINSYNLVIILLITAIKCTF